MALALDGTPQPGTGSSPVATTIGITTFSSNDVLYCYVRTFGSGGQVATCSSPTLGTWTQRATANDGSSHFTFAFYAIAASPLSTEVVTVTFTSGTIVVADMIVFAVSGANISAPFDAGGPQTTGTSTPASMTTVNPVTMIITGGESASGTWNVASPWTAIGATGNSLYNEYRLASSTGTFSGAITGDTIQCGSIDAIIQASSAPTVILCSQICM